jgi:hypothetical protein
MKDIRMVTKSEAEAIVQKWLDEHKLESWHQGKLVEITELGISAVQEYPWGWMFFYDTKQCIETGDFIMRWQVMLQCMSREKTVYSTRRSQELLTL